MNVIDAKSTIKFFELAAALTGFIYFRKLRGTVWQYFPFFLLTLFLFEYYGYILAVQKKYTSNANLYKYIVAPAIVYFYSYLFWSILPRRFNKLICAGIILFTIGLGFELTLLQSLHTFFASLSYSIANLFFLVYAMCYYTELVISDQLLNFTRLISFWFCLGVLLFYLGSLPYFGLYNILVENYKESIFISYSWVYVILNYLMYIIFSIGFIWGRKQS